MTNKQLRQTILKGYLSLLESADPNGRYNHKRQNFIQGLRNSIKLGRDIKPEYEQELRDLIHKLYEWENWNGNCSNIKQEFDV